MLFVLTLVGTCSAIDRTIVSTVTESVRHEFHLSDAQLGLFTGLAFSITYALVALPAGAIADRVNRRLLMAGALAAWTAATMVTGLVRSYTFLLIARMGVGAGESSGQPAVMSSVADLFPAHRRSTAIAIYYLSAPISVLVAGAVGALLTADYGWRVAMAAVAFPGLVVSVILLFCPDIPRAVTAQPAGAVAPADAEPAPSFGEVLKFILSQRSLVHLSIAVALATMVTSSLGSFSFSFFLRYHHLSLRQLGLVYSLSGAALFFVSILGGGFVADRLGRRDPKLRLWVIIAFLLVALPAIITGCLASSIAIALPGYLFSGMVTGVWFGPATGTAQNLARPQMRSRVAAILFVLQNVVGVGLGPWITGEVSDLWRAHAHTDGLRFALIVTTLAGFWAALHFVLATRTLEKDLARAAGAGA
jgi:MFS family permease